MFKKLGLLVLLIASTQSYAGLDLSIVGGGNRASAKLTGFDGTGIIPQTSYNGGVLLGFTLDPSITIETGLEYIDRKYDYFAGAILGIYGGDFTTHQDVTYIQVPLTINIKASGFLTLGAGGYYAHKLSNSVTGEIVFPGSTLVVTGLTSSEANANYGAIGLIRLMPVDTSSMAIFFDGRYLYGISNITTAVGGKSQARDVMVQLGVTFKYK